MSLSSYLASKYLTAEKPASSSSSGKKRKRKQPTEGLIIADDDALGWSTTAQTTQEDDGRPLTVSSGSAEFKKSKKNAWKTVGVPALQPTIDEAGEREADAIIAQAAAENAQAMQEDEEPVYEGIEKMGDGTHAGLQSAADVTRQFEKRKKEEAAAWARDAGKSGKGEETVYRDATGRRIDLSMRRQDAKRELEAKAKKEKEEEDLQKGDVQLAARSARREALEDAKFMPVARGVDDVEMNDEMKGQDRWNDPAMEFLETKKKGRSKSGKPLYEGSAMPNRYGIRPGHKWDGVDRGNGWEGERFKALNRKQRNKELNFEWQMDE